LRAYCLDCPEDWDAKLRAAEFAYNNSVHASTGFSPFFLNYGQHPRTPAALFAAVAVDAPPLAATISRNSADAFAAKMRLLVSRAKQHLETARERQKRFSDARRFHLTFEVGDMVWLNSGNLAIAGPHKKKLSPRWIGPFKVLQVINPVAYKLELPSHTKAHPVFHVSNLKPYQDGSSEFPERAATSRLPPAYYVGSEPAWVVERIVSEDLVNGQRVFLVKWKGYAEPSHTDAALLEHDVPDLVREFYAARGTGSTSASSRRGRRAAAPPSV
jgi:hypothetical protein